MMSVRDLRVEAGRRGHRAPRLRPVRRLVLVRRGLPVATGCLDDLARRAWELAARERMFWMTNPVGRFLMERSSRGDEPTGFVIVAVEEV